VGAGADEARSSVFPIVFDCSCGKHQVISSHPPAPTHVTAPWLRTFRACSSGMNERACLASIGRACMATPHSLRYLTHVRVQTRCAANRNKNGVHGSTTTCMRAFHTPSIKVPITIDQEEWPKSVHVTTRATTTVIGVRCGRMQAVTCVGWVCTCAPPRVPDTRHLAYSCK
jgi:hypothetical protein